LRRISPWTALSDCRGLAGGGGEENAHSRDIRSSRAGGLRSVPPGAIRRSRARVGPTRQPRPPSARRRLEARASTRPRHGREARSAATGSRTPCSAVRGQPPSPTPPAARVHDRGRFRAPGRTPRRHRHALGFMQHGAQESAGRLCGIHCARSRIFPIRARARPRAFRALPPSGEGPLRGFRSSRGANGFTRWSSPIAARWMCRAARRP
jgi:hypothetical protein